MVLGSYTNGNVQTTILTDGTKIRFTEDNDFNPAFAENMDIKITDCCDMGCPYCHEGSTVNGKHGDINHPFFKTLHPYQEVALGGGNVLEHPNLIELLINLKANKVIANITVNQKHFMDNLSLLHELTDKKLIHGLGVSLTNPSDELISSVQQFPNAVIHVITGIVTLTNLYKLSDKNLKILILGYKNLRRGHQYIEDDDHFDDTIENQCWLASALPSLFSKFKVVSFDNIAIDQLEVKKHLSAEQWERFYAGDDGTNTYYIDLVNEQFARSSTAPFDKRYALQNNVDDMFDYIKEGN